MKYSKGKKSTNSKTERRTEPKTASKDDQKGEDRFSQRAINVNKEVVKKSCDEFFDRLLIQEAGKKKKKKNEISTTTTTTTTTTTATSKDRKLGKDWSPAMDGILVDEVDIKKCDKLYDELMIQGKRYTRRRLPVFEKICPK
ncbi:hypothetical protein Dimus_023783 [Dionaea muscipula]